MSNPCRRPQTDHEMVVTGGQQRSLAPPHSGTLPSQDRSAISVVPWSRASTYCPEGSGRGGAGTNSAASGASRSSASSSDGPVATMLIGLAGLTGLGILLAVPAAILTSAVMPALYSGLDRGDSQPPLGKTERCAACEGQLAVARSHRAVPSAVTVSAAQPPRRPFSRSARGATTRRGHRTRAPAPALRTGRGPRRRGGRATGHSSRG